MKNLSLLILVLLTGCLGKAQENNKTLQKVYSSAISHHYKGKSAYILISDSTVNEYIFKTNYLQISNEIISDVPPMMDISKMDSSWGSALRRADTMKLKLKGYKLPPFKTDDVKIEFVKNAVGSKPGVGEKVQLSSIILIDNKKAIVELNISGDIQNAYGLLYFMEKQGDKWIVISSMETWVS